MPNLSEATIIRPENAQVTVYSGCLAADSWWKIPARAGQRFKVQARIDVGCDSRGWSCDNWATKSGPEGVPGYFVGGSLGGIGIEIGALIGAISQIDAGTSMDEAMARRIFTAANVRRLGSNYDAASPSDGFLYLDFNDTWTWGDNKGSVHVEVTLFP